MFECSNVRHSAVLCLLPVAYCLLPIVYCLLPATGSFAQGEANFWYFGQNAGVNFNGGVPVAVTNGQVNTYEGSASVSDTAGNLLFYTDGIAVWNKNHVQMPNGSGLMGHSSATQSGVIIQKPGNAAFYYIFTVDAGGGANGIRYTEVDMLLNGGLGDVTANKNILLNTPSCEKITGVRHCNNQDVWVVTHDWNSDAFRTYLVTSTGVNTTPVVSNAGLMVTGNLVATFGQLKVSPGGTKLASATYSPINRFELFDFNISTGIVYNAILFPQFTGSPYGVEFSPDGTKMYGAILAGRIYQFNLCAGSNTAIANSGVLIGNSASYSGSLQLGPDKKIYVTRGSGGFGVPWLGVINNPNTLGVGCSYVDNGVSLSGRNSYLGLPNFVSYYFKQTPPPFMVSDTCLSVTFTAPTINITNCSVSTNAITSLSWDFGDPVSGATNTSILNNPTHTFSSAGTYTVTLVLNYACGSDTIKQNVTVVNCGITATAISTNVLCKGQCTGTATANTSGGTSPYTYSWTAGQTTQIATGLCLGNYTVTITDVTGATAMATVTIANGSGPTANAAGTSVLITSGNSTNLTATGGGVYLWSTGDTTDSIIVSPTVTTRYCVTVTDSNGCTDTACITVTVIIKPIDCSNAEELYLPNAFSPNDDGENDKLQIYYGNLKCIKTFNLIIYNRWGEKIFTTNDPSAQWDGSCKGKIESTAVYVYYLETTLTNEEKITKKGNISLIK